MQSEFKKTEYVALFNYNNLPMGRLLGFSKSAYRDSHPDDVIIFNANILTKSNGKVWYGDINVTHDFDNLKNVADTLGEDLYILYESDCRFENENKTIEELLSKAVNVIKCKK
jgi:hypothetical protein